MGAASFYIYYRVQPERADHARTLADRLLDAIEQRCNVRGQLLVRKDEPLLWMEVYPAVPNQCAFEAALAAECERLDFATALLPGSVRHIECFMEPERCA